MTWVDPPDYVAGQVLTATQMDAISTDLNYLYSVSWGITQHYSANQASDVALVAATPASLISFDFTIYGDNPTVQFFGTFDLSANATTGNGLMIGQAKLDGVTANGQAYLNEESADTRATVGQNWQYNADLLGVGGHNFTLQAYKLGGSGSALAKTQTRLLVAIRDPR